MTGGMEQRELEGIYSRKIPGIAIGGKAHAAKMYFTFLSTTLIEMAVIFEKYRWVSSCWTRS